jgi:flagellar operon protein
MNKITNQFTSIEQVTNQYLINKSKPSGTIQEQNGLSFEEILRKKQQAIPTEGSTLKFSKHALNRLEERSIELSDEQVNRLNEGAKKASEKGIKESLVIMDSLAFIVNVQNNTVVTAIDQTTTNENIFTNIDGAVII